MDHPYREWAPGTACLSCEQRERRALSWRFVIGVVAIAVLAVNAAWSVMAFVTLKATERVLAETERLQSRSLLGPPTPPPPHAAPPPAAPVLEGPPRGIGIAELDATHYLIERGVLWWFFQEARFAPEREDGQVVGVRMADVFPGSLLGRLGFESGDRLDDISGIPLNTPERTMAAFERLSKSPEFSLVVTRGKSRVTLKYTVL